MKNTMQKFLLAAVAGLLVSSQVYAGTVTASGTTSLQVNVANEAAITVTDATTTLTTSKTDFSANYVGTTNFTFKLRTTKAGGTGTITVLAGTDLTSGPDTIAANLVTFTSTAGVGSAQSGTLSNSVAQNITTFGADAHSASAGSPGTVTWTLPDDPAYKTGAYSATVTFTISGS